MREDRSPISKLRALFALIGAMPADAEPIASLSGVSIDDVRAHLRLGTLLVYDGHVIGVAA